MLKSLLKASVLPLLLVVLLLSFMSVEINSKREYTRNTDRLETQMKEKDTTIDNLQKQIQDLKKQNEKLQKIAEKIAYYEGLSEKTGLSIQSIALIHNLAKEYDPAIQLGLISLESNFGEDLTHYNTNGSIDRGLCQINDGGTAQWLWSQVFPKQEFNVDKLYDPLVSIRLSAYYLNGLFKQYDGDVNKALTHYNKGDRKSVV